jgi:hypothetical protein
LSGGSAAPSTSANWPCVRAIFKDDYGGVRSRWCSLAATIRPIISCRKCGGYDADRRKQFYVRDRGRFVSDDPRRAIHHQGRLRDRA